MAYVWKTVPEFNCFVGKESIYRHDHKKRKKYLYGLLRELFYADRKKAEQQMEKLANDFYEIWMHHLEVCHSDNQEHLQEWKDRGFRKVKTKTRTYWEIPSEHEDDRIGATMCFVVKTHVIE